MQGRGCMLGGDEMEAGRAQNTLFILASCVVGWVLSLAPSAPAELKPGDVLEQQNAEQAKGLLPPEFYDAYRRGDFRHEIGKWSPEGLDKDPVFAEADRKSTR